METIYTWTYWSPAGELMLGSCGGRLCMCDWTASPRHDANCRRLSRRLHARICEGPSDTIRSTIAQLDEYFAGNRREFSIPLLQVGTDFQRLVWQTLAGIPYSSTVSYKTLAEMAGRPSAVRAVATAVASNPVSVIVPCHRVIAHDHSLGGYAGGPAAKALLLGLENG